MAGHGSGTHAHRPPLRPRFTSYHITSYHVTSYHITSYHITPHHVIMGEVACLPQRRLFASSGSGPAPDLPSPPFSTRTVDTSKYLHCHTCNRTDYCIRQPNGLGTRPLRNAFCNIACRMPPPRPQIMQHEPSRYVVEIITIGNSGSRNW